MEDYRLEQSGQEVQEILNGAAMQVDLTEETERATEAEQTLQDNIDAEATRAQGAEGTLQDNIDAEETRAKTAEKQNADDIDAIEEKIPSGASSSNKLATEEYVADAVATATATFRGTYNLVSDLHLNVTATEQQIAAALAGAISTADNNDYCFIQVPTSSETPTEIKEIDRYKFNGTAWAFEYKLNNSGFTAAQWAAINSGITSGDVAKLAVLPTNAQLTTLLAGLQSDIDGEETRAKAAELALQGNIDAEEARAKAAEKQNADDIDAIEAVIPESASSENKVATKSEIDSLSAAIEAILLLIPSAATSLNKLADKAYVNSSIATATATFRGTYNLVNDLGLTTSATHAQISTALAGAILTADNNDYAFVQIPTSDAMPTEIAKTERYKFNGTAWEYEYDLNNSGFTADQWAAINSGITQALVTKLRALPTNAELTTELGTLTSSITAINQKIPNAASQANKLVDTAAMESYIVQVLDVLTISYNVTSTDGHVTLSIEQVDGKITFVTLTTSDIASAAALNLKASQADLTALASRVTTAEGNITSLGGRMTTAEGNITSLGGRMTTAEGNITSLGGRVSTNETDIANLQQLYNDLQQSKPVPVTALPSTGQQQGVIYRLAGTTSYSDYMWNGSTWVLMATYNNAIDPRPKKASQNLVTSGGVFDNMGALDVSELNATENPHTLAQYVDLSAALAAIPTDYQKGGMSIKFVQSSDNKYVQYRYMETDSTTVATFTNVANWQGVDDVPTVGSDNLVKSGGVYEEISQLGQEINGLPPVIIDLSEYELITGTIYSDNKFYNTGGFANHRIKMIPCGDYAGRNVTIVPGPESLSYNTFQITFLKENVVAGSEVVYATGYAYPLVYTGEQTLEIPIDAQYLYIYIKDIRQESDTTPSSVVVDGISGDFYKSTEVDALLLPLKESVGTNEGENLTVYKTGSIFFIKEYASPYKELSEDTIVIVKRLSGAFSAVKATIFRNNIDRYLDFIQIDDETFILQLLQSDKVHNIYIPSSSGPQVGDTCEVSYKSGLISDIFNIQEQFEHNVGINQSEDVTAFAEGSVKYIKKYSPYLTYSYPVTIVAERKSGTATEVMCEIDRGGTTQYLGFTRISETTFVFKEQVGDAIRSLYIGNGAAGDGFTLTYKSYLNAEIFDLEVSAENVSKRVFRKNLNWVAIGDSLTDVQTLGVGVDNYVNLVGRALQLNAINKGVSGTGYMKEQDVSRAFYQRIPNFTEDADIITIFGSFNDLSAGTLGTALDTGTTTVGGCMNETIDVLTTKYPNALIGIIAPTPWWESFDYTTYPQYRQYVELLKDVAKRYSIPFLNLFDGSNLRPWDDTFNYTYFKHTELKPNGDGCHPNTAGHKRFAGMIQDFIEQLVYSASDY